MSVNSTNVNQTVTDLITGYIKSECVMYIPTAIIDVMASFHGMYDASFNSNIIFDDNKISLMELLVKQFNEYTKLERIYSGKLNGLTSENFHYRCDYYGPTIVLIENTLGYIFGGYTSIPWKTSEYGEFATDKNAFLFQLHPKSKIFYQNSWDFGEHAVFHSKKRESSDLLAFGGGFDLLIHVNGNKNNKSYVSKCTFEMKNDNELAGNKTFMVKDMEIFMCQHIWKQ